MLRSLQRIDRRAPEGGAKWLKQFRMRQQLVLNGFGKRDEFACEFVGQLDGPGHANNIPLGSYD